MSSIEIHIPDLSKILESRLLSVIDSRTMHEIHDIFAKRCDPYVPMDEGALAQSVQVYDDSIVYPGPYAHYQYVGIVYGPNIPIYENGVLVGWRSPKDKKKHPTGRDIQYSHEKHDRASREWDKAMLKSEDGQIFLSDVAKILEERWDELYGNS